VATFGTLAGCLRRIFVLAESTTAGFYPVMAQTLQHVHVYRTDAVAAEEQRQIRLGVQKMLKHPDQVRAFLIKGGFITKSGKLTKRYRD
jgi:hypothetical protein